MKAYLFSIIPKDGEMPRYHININTDIPESNHLYSIQWISTANTKEELVDLFILLHELKGETITDEVRKVAKEFVNEIHEKL